MHLKKISDGGGERVPIEIRKDRAYYLTHRQHSGWLKGRYSSRREAARKIKQAERVTGHRRVEGGGECNENDDIYA